MEKSFYLKGFLNVALFLTVFPNCNHLFAKKLTIKPDTLYEIDQKTVAELLKGKEVILSLEASLSSGPDEFPQNLLQSLKEAIDDDQILAILPATADLLEKMWAEILRGKLAVAVPSKEIIVFARLRSKDNSSKSLELAFYG